MNIINITNNNNYLLEYFSYCSKEWGSKKSNLELKEYAQNKTKELLKNKNDKIISILALIENNKLIGFISLFNYDGEYKKELTPWYATMFVKKKFRNKGYSKILHYAILTEAKKLGYSKIYLKTYLTNYYEKFGAIYIEKLPNNENLYYIKL